MAFRGPPENRIPVSSDAARAIDEYREYTR